MEDVDVAGGSHFWRGRRVLVTGHTGFKGGWLALWLTTLGAEVTGLALDPEPGPSFFACARVGEAVDSVIADIRDLAPVSAVVARTQPEIVFHLAAQALVRESYASPVATFATNVMGTAHVLEAVRTTPGVRAVVIVTSDKCYENREWPWAYREADALGGHDPYSSSKSAAEIVAAAYRRSFFQSTDAPVPIATARAGNVIGGGDFAKDRLIPDLVRAALQGTTVPLRNPAAVRPWQFVLDPLAGYLRLAEALAAQGQAVAEAWNFGPSDSGSHTVGWIATQFAAALASSARPALFEYAPLGSDSLHEANLLRLDTGKARSRLGWQPVLDTQRAIEWTATWYSDFMQSRDMAAATRSQIEAFAQASQPTPAPAGPSL